MNTPFMTSPIGDLTIDSEGLRTAIDEIARLRKILVNEMSNRTSLRIHYSNKTGIDEIAVKSVTVIKTKSSKEYLYYETFTDETGYGTKIDMETIDSWEVKGSLPCGGGALLKL